MYTMIYDLCKDSVFVELTSAPLDSHLRQANQCKIDEEKPRGLSSTVEFFFFYVHVLYLPASFADKQRWLCMSSR